MGNSDDIYNGLKSADGSKDISVLASYVSLALLILGVLGLLTLLVASFGFIPDWLGWFGLGLGTIFIFTGFIINYVAQKR